MTSRFCTALGSAESSKQDQEKCVVVVREKDQEIAELQKQLAALNAEKEQHVVEKSTSS